MKYFRPNRFAVVSLSVILLSLFTVFYKSDSASTKTNTLLVPSLTATKTAALDSTNTPTAGDLNGNGVINPGDRLLYTITIPNTGADPATGVSLADTIDANTTLLGGSVIASPIAVNDTFTSIGNVGITVPDGASDLLANDLDTNNPVSQAALVFTKINNTNFVSGTPVATTNGSVTVNSNGSFSYTPNVGFEGSDTFSYTLGNGTGLTDTSTVTITTSGMIWFVNSALGTNGNGTLNSPFNCLTGAGCFSAATADKTGDSVFLYSSANAYAGGLTLLANQKLIGQGASGTLTGAGSITGINTLPTFSNTLPSTGGANPTVTTTVAATNGINLGAGNTVRGVTIGNTTGAKLFGSGFGTLTLGNNTTPDVTLNGTGQALNLTNGTFANTSALSSLTTASSTAQGVSLTSVAGTVAFGSTTISGSTSQGIFVTTSTADINFGNTAIGTALAGTGGTNAVSLSSNSGGTRTFGTLTIQNTNGPSNVAFLMASGGNVVAGTTSITGVAGTGNGIDIQSLAAGTTVSFGATAINKSASPGTLVNLGAAATPNAGNVTFASLNGTASNGSGLVGTDNTGSITVTSNTSSLTTTNGPAINITKSANPVTPINLNFTAISSTNSTTNGLNFNRVSGAMNITGSGTPTNISNSTGTGIQIQNSAATFSFANTTKVSDTGNANADATGTGVFLNANTAALTFADLDIAPDTGERGLQATSNTGTLTTTSGTFSSTNGTAAEITGVSAASKTPLNITLTSVTVSGNASGIRLINTSSTGSPGGFKIVGSASTAASGGTISNISGADGSNTAGIGVYLDNVSDITLQNMTFSGTFGNFGIRGDSVTNFTLRDSNLGGTFGTNESIDEGTIRFGTENLLTTSGIKGTALFEGNTIGGGYENNLSVYVYGSDTLNMTVQDSTNDPAIFNDQSSNLGDDALHIESGGTGSNVTLLVNGVRFNGARGDQLQTSQIGVTTQTLTITNNEFLNTAPGIVSGGGGVWLLGGSLANTSNVTVTYNFSGNTIKGAQGDAFRAIYTGYAATINGLILNNTIGTPGSGFQSDFNGGSTNGGNGIDVGHAKGALTGFSNSGTINHAVRIEGNTIRDIKNGNAGIVVTNGSKAGGTSRLEATVKNNTVAEVGPDLLAGFYAIVGGTGSGDISQTGLVITGNTFTAGTVNGGSAIYLDQILTSVGNYYIPGYTITASSSKGENSGGTASTNLETFWKAPVNTLINGPFPGPTGNPATGKQVDAGNTKNITNNAFTLAVPTMSPPAEEGANQMAFTLDNYFDFQNISDQSPSEMLSLIEPVFKHSTNAEIVSQTEIAKSETTVQAIGTVPASEAIETQNIDYLSKVSVFVGDASNILSEFTGILDSLITPTVSAQESKKIISETKSDQLSPTSGETINKQLGTIPAGEKIVVQFKATIDSNLPTNDFSVSNQATISGSNFPNVLTDGDPDAADIQATVTTVVHPPTISKAFGTNSISFGSSATLTFTITNPNPSTTLDNVAFTDNLPGGLVVANPNGLDNKCTGSTVTAVPDSTSISVFAPSRNAATSCTIVVNVRGTSVGNKNNLTEQITSKQSNAGGTAAATMTVTPPSIGGTVSYGITALNQPQKFVPNVQLTTSGASVVSVPTDAVGTYLLENLTPNGQYTVTPTKSGNVNGITAFDATLVLRHVAAGGSGPNNLTGNQLLAADADGAGGVTSFDATLILRYVAANGANANTGQVGNWKFNPPTKTYNPLSGSFSGENYQGILIGEVNGDWTP